MNIDDALLLGRIAFVAALYLFLIVLALLLRRDLKARASHSDERAPADLLIVDPGETGLEPGERIPLLALSTVGRGADNSIVMNDTFISTDHARLSWNGKGWVLEDLESTNGTTLNSKPVQRAVAVRVGDTIEFGRVRARLVDL